VPLLTELENWESIPTVSVKEGKKLAKGN